MPFDPYEISFFGLTIFAFLYGFYGFKQPGIFGEIVEMDETIPENGDYQDPDHSAEKKYSRSGLKQKEANNIKMEILKYMEQEKPYLERELSIGDLAKHLRTSRHYITEVINYHMGKNFYYFINEYRVEEVKRRLLDPRYRNLTILAIAYDAGFNSKSAFNTIFKDMTGMTPTEYYKKMIVKS
jgi:AraC-like DNA-binding protein